MSCVSNSAPRGARSGFTLLEVILSVAILALITVALYRFVVTDLEAIHLSTDDTTRKTAVQSLVATLHEEFCHLPPQQASALIGRAHKFNDRESDEITWLTQAGNGLFTQQAEGMWKVTLALRPEKKSNTYVLGLVRELPDNTDKKNEHWLPLLRDVDALNIAYFDRRMNYSGNQWTDPNAVPELVRIRIWRTGQTVPYDAVIELPPTRFPTL